MSALLIAAIICMTLALTFYTIGVFSERLNGMPWSFGSDFSLIRPEQPLWAGSRGMVFTSTCMGSLD